MLKIRTAYTQQFCAKYETSKMLPKKPHTKYPMYINIGWLVIIINEQCGTIVCIKHW